MAPCGTGVPPVVPCRTGLQPVFVFALPSCRLVAYTARHGGETSVEESKAYEACRVADAVREILDEEIARKLRKPETAGTGERTHIVQEPRDT